MSKPVVSQSDCISVSEYTGGVLCVDSGFVRDRMACCYILESDSEIAIIETGTNASVQRLKDVIRIRGWNKKAVRYVIATHVHLDHAGGAGSLMQEFPDATFLVHPRGAAHMIDPSKLEASVRRVYGDEIFDATYGTLIPIDEKRVQIMEDGDSVALGNRDLLFIDTPGHARHHFCVWDERTRGWFTGDTFGLSYRELDTAKGAYIFPTTTPIEFDPEALKYSISRLLEKDPGFMYLTHYGRVGNVNDLANQMMSGIDAIVDIAERNEHHDDFSVQFKREFTDWLTDSVRSHGVSLDERVLQSLLLPDIDLNTQGVEVWLSRRKKNQP
jgi:glyoxylase-like metal-dependent hydrolase (beta-lactamase superfamily II)